MRKKLSVLLVEDNAADVMSITQAFQDTDKTIAITHSSNGEEALSYLAANDRNLPGIIVLDLNMPVMDGFVFLAELRQNAVFKSIPVVVLTGHNDEFHRTGSFDHNIAGFMEKPSNYVGYKELIKKVISYWSLSKLVERP